MPLTKTKVQEAVTKFQKHPKDTGNSSVQIALITERIKYLSEHLKTFKKDFSSQRGLLMLVGQRRSLLDYVRLQDREEYQRLLKSLDLRK